MALVTFTIGNAINTFPMAIFKVSTLLFVSSAVRSLQRVIIWQSIGAVTIRFTLTSSQGGARTLDIGTTLAFAGARPQIQLNGFSGAIPAIPNQPDSHGVTRGTWRGNNIMYSVSIREYRLQVEIRLLNAYS